MESGGGAVEKQAAEEHIGLRFLIGEFCLCVARFRGVVVRSAFGRGPDRPDERAAELLNSRNIDAVYFPMVPADQQPGRVAWTTGAIRYCSRVYPLYYVALAGAFDEYLERQFTGKTRKHMRRDLAKLNEFCGGALALREYRRPEEMAEFQRLARSLSELTYQERLLAAGLPDTPEFLRMLEERAGRDELRCYILFHAERPIAFRYCGGRERHLTLLITGYDPRYREFAPGRILLYLMLERLFAEHRFDGLDFGQGEAGHKSMFATGCLHGVDIHYFRRTPWHLAIVLAHLWLAAICRTATRLVRALGIKDKLKLWLRGHSGGKGK